ncbi:hypothetical protein C0081_16060 [Cohaesibacter celericrescens]|uniref:Alkaline proteinase inhibitor/ Outer membrane lipoprotein Omp19 domain-containing protein n=2 Tax=Cohaesibacter celericrescens TaxID=2067669 RepID=A0A2N5XPF8_9HYPH|nr:hypothetical protein C0081_16060 [Cohaesibacter celericrescens]
MNRHSYIFVVLTGALALGGCAVSSNMVPSRPSVASAPVVSNTLPPLPSLVASARDASLESDSMPEKFSQSDQKMLAVEAPDESAEDIRAEIQQAYANEVLNRPVISTERSSLKPFVGRWTLATTSTRSKVKQVGTLLGISDRCELVLEDVSVEYGYKASGASACPTSLFMLDSWVAYNSRLVLRDHMGDEIVKLTSRGSNVWVGVNKDGNTVILNKS